jgi:hypothetical protein
VPALQVRVGFPAKTNKSIYMFMKANLKSSKQLEFGTRLLSKIEAFWLVCSVSRNGNIAAVLLFLLAFTGQLIGQEGGGGSTNLALNPSRTGTPSPLESDGGWGGGSYPWDMVDGQRSYNTWARGLAFTGGHTGDWNSAGYLSPCGPRQATIDFGGSRNFSKVVVWHHGAEHAPQSPFLQYWNDGRWLDIAFQRVYGREEAPGTNSGNSISDEYTFAPVTGSKLRYGFNNCGTNILGTPIIHGWIYEIEVFLEQQCENIVISSQQQSQRVVVGGTVAFSTSATGTMPISYQWRFNGQSLSDATSPVLTLQNVQPAQAGVYSVVLSNCAGSVTSDEAALIVISDTNRLFNIGEIPNAKAWPGQTLEFMVGAPDLGPEAVLSLSVVGAVLGNITFDASSGQFRYVPDVVDKRPFTVRIVATLAGQTRTQDVEITPMPHLQPEETTFSLTPMHPLPDPESNDYIVRQEMLSATEESFNTQMRKTRTVVVMGKDVVFQRGHPNGLFDGYHDTADLKSLTVYAERMIVRDAVKLPQTEVTIYARHLIFQDGSETALIDTTPVSITNRAASASGTTPGRDGINGLQAGSITLYAESLSLPGNLKRFIMAGGNGQSAGLGRDGIDGQSITPYPAFDGCSRPTIYSPKPDNTVGIWFKQTTCTGNKCSDAQPGNRWIDIGNGSFTYKETAWPTSGTDAVAPGKPGEPGAGGNLTCNLNIASIANSQGGIPGSAAPRAIGGQAGTPSPAYVFYIGCEGPSLWSPRYTSSGTSFEAPQPKIVAGTNGRFQQAGHPLSWVTPHAVRQVLAHAKDAYLYGYFDAARAVLLDYDALIAGYSTNAAWQTQPLEWQAELAALQSEMHGLLHRLANNLDYFGNPAGWVPMLSFEANLNLFRNEIEPAIRVLYLSYWVGNAASNLQQKVEALASARAKLSAEVERFRADYASVVEAMPDLETEYISISNNTVRVQAYLEQLNQALEARAQQTVEDRHKVPEWKKGLKMASAMMSVIPAYQPALGAVGQGLNLIADYNAEDPGQTASGLWQLRQQFSPEKMKESMTSWTNELSRLNLTNFTLRNSSYLKTLEPYGKALLAGYDAYRSINKKVQAPANEVEAELLRLKASDPAFNQAVDEVSMLMAQQDVFARRLADALQASARLTDGITHNLLAIDGLNRDASYGLAILDARAVSYLKEMERRARERLLKYHYYLAKSYEYRLLRPYLGELRLDRLFDAFKDLVAAGKGQELSLQDYEALRTVYEEQLSSVAQEIVEIFNASPTERSLTIPVNVPAEQLADLRPDHPIKVRFQRRDWFFPSEENLRIANLAVAPGGLGVHFLGQRSPFKLAIAHSGVSHLAYDGVEYLFRHYNGSTRNPLRWGVRYNTDGSVSPEQASDATQSLLYSLLARSGLQANILLFARPAVDADLEISMETATANIPVVTNLTLQLTFDYTDRRTDIRTLDVMENADGLAPYFIVDTTDLNGKQDGRGGFRRTFRRGAQATIEAPAHVGKWWFTHWVAGHDLGPQATNRTLRLDMSTDRVVRADYQFLDEIDLDNDGLPDRWEALYFGGLSFGANDDLDHDGFTNAEELHAGSVPDQANSPLRFVQMSTDGGQISLVWSTLPGTSYQLQVRQTLHTGDWEDYGQGMIATGNQLRAVIPNEAPFLFFRVMSK